MAVELSKLDAVRLAREQIGEASSAELAAFIEQQFGVRMQPAIVAVLLASLREREQLEQSKRRALEAAEQKAEEEKKAGEG